jgi:hypothetical protein
LAESLEQRDSAVVSSAGEPGRVPPGRPPPDFTASNDDPHGPLMPKNLPRSLSATAGGVPMSKSRLLCVVALTVVACAGSMTSTAVLQERGEDGGMVRIVCPVYPPDADTQAKAATEMAKVCTPRAWRVTEIRLTDRTGPVGYLCTPNGCGGPSQTREQQVDLKFACVAR